MARPPRQAHCSDAALQPFLLVPPGPQTSPVLNLLIHFKVMTLPGARDAQPARSRAWVLVALFLAAGTLFFFANRPAYNAYFSDDDLDKMGWPTLLPNAAFVKQIVTPEVSPNLFRPIGYLYYR